MASHPSDIGFRAQDAAEWQALILRAAEHGERLEVPGVGAYVRWAPGAGVELWAQVDADDRLVGLSPHFAGDGRLPFGALELRPGQPGTLDGSLHGWADPAPDNPGSGIYPLLVDVPDARLAQARLAPPAIVTLQVAAFAHALACYPDEAAYYAAQEQEPRFAVEALIPSGLFARQEEVERAEAVFAGRVLRAEMRTNPASGAAFHALLVRTLGGVFDVVADPTVVTGEPVVGGGVVRCVAWLSGRVIDLEPRLSRSRGSRRGSRAHLTRRSTYGTEAPQSVPGRTVRPGPSSARPMRPTASVEPDSR